MSKAANIRKERGFYRPNGAAARTKVTSGYIGPREPGAHGKTRQQTHIKVMDDAMESLRKKMAARKTKKEGKRSDHDVD